MQAPILQQLAFLDATAVAEEPHSIAWRRRQVFEDETGGTWRAIAVPCIREVTPFSLAQFLCSGPNREGLASV